MREANNADPVAVDKQAMTRMGDAVAGLASEGLGQRSDVLAVVSGDPCRSPLGEPATGWGRRWVVAMVAVLECIAAILAWMHGIPWLGRT